MTKEAKTQIVIDNYFKSECDVNTSIRKAFEKGFRIGVQKGSVVAEPVKRGRVIDGKCSVCNHKMNAWACDFVYCPYCKAKMDEVEDEEIG